MTTDFRQPSPKRRSEPGSLQPVAVLVLVLALSGCGGGLEEPKGVQQSDLGLRSADFEDGGSLPRELTCDQEDGRSPALAWARATAADSYVLTMTDPDADNFVHWVLWRIDGTIDTLEANSVPPGAAEGSNDFGERGYGPPCPPEGDGAHRYVVTLYRLESPGAERAAEVAPSSSASEVLEAVACCIEGKDTLTGTYERP